MVDRIKTRISGHKRVTIEIDPSVPIGEFLLDKEADSLFFALYNGLPILMLEELHTRMYGVLKKKKIDEMIASINREGKLAHLLIHPEGQISIREEGLEEEEEEGSEDEGFPEDYYDEDEEDEKE